MKTAISLPDDVFAEAERLRRRLKKSRSRLFSEAVADYVARHDADRITTQLNEVWDEVRPESDEFVSAAARATLELAEWS